MALKGERVELETDISLTMASIATRGVTVCYKTMGSGVALGNSAGVADLYASASGNKVVGILMNDVVNVDQTKYHKNFHKDETILNERCRILRKGRVTTNAVTGTPVGNGDTAYLTANGVLTPTLSTTGGLVATPKVGVFVSKLDADGYATVDVNLPIA